MNKFLLSKYLNIGSKCTAMFFGGMLMLVFMNEELYTLNQLYPHTAQILTLATFLLIGFFEYVKERLE